MFGGGGDESSKKVDTVSFASTSFADKLSGSPAGDFWGAEQAWQREELAKPFVIQLSDPQTIGGTFTSYTTYLVNSTLCREGVRRRYSDFDWLRELLMARFHGLAVPIMPEKRLVGNQSKSFIEERMAGLDQFAALLLANPYLRLDATLRIFLTEAGVAEWEQAKKAASAGAGATPDTNPGLARWFGVLRQLPLPVDADAACHELQAATDALEANVSASLNAVTKYWEASRATADALRGMRDALNDWSTVSGANAASLSSTLGALREHTSALAGRVKKSGDAFSNAHDLAVFTPNEIQMFLLDGLVTEAQRVRSLKSLLAVRDAAQGDYSKAWGAQDKLAYQVKGFREKGREDKAIALEPKLAEAVGLMRLLKGRVDDITKGLLYVESDRLARARLIRFVAMAGQYAALCIASGLRTQEVWSAFLGAMDLDQNAQVADAQATLTGQASMHGIDAVPGAVASLPLPTAVVNGVPFVPGAASPFAVGGSSSSGGYYAAASAAPGSPSDSTGGALFTGSSTSGGAGSEPSVGAPMFSGSAFSSAGSGEGSAAGGGGASVDL